MALGKELDSALVLRWVEILLFLGAGEVNLYHDRPLSSPGEVEAARSSLDRLEVEGRLRTRRHRWAAPYLE